ncbi:MAG TPA: beta-N-acetylhexosaminidase [Gaiellaceae bacterium]|nr:beta-N-acetylhexosaminidase [Gaiellaceae bacterium]
MSAGGLEPAAAACVFPGFPGTTVPDWLRRELEGGLGGVVLFAFNVRDPDQLAALTAELRAERDALVVAVDEEGGDVTRLEADRGSSFPGNLALGAVDDVELTRRVAAAIGGELAAVGVNMNLAPVADVNVDPAAAIVGVRSFGSDPQLVARHVAAYVEGLQDTGVAACAKHYPGHGEVTGDSHLELPTAETDRQTLLARALPPFAAAVDAGVRSVMTAHIRFPAIDQQPATISAPLIGLLRSELGFDGVVITDALEMRAIAGTVGLEEGAVQAIAAGADALCLGAERSPAEVARVRDALVAAVRDGRVAEERLHEAAERVAELAAWTTSLQPGHDLEAGAEAARRALRAEGDLVLPANPLVVELWPEATIAAGPAHHGLGELLGAETVRLHEGEPFPQPADPARVVVVVRDAHRHAWQRELVPAGALVVETGVPAWRPPEARGYVVTHGAGRANLAAAAGLLAPR